MRIAALVVSVCFVGAGSAYAQSIDVSDAEAIVTSDDALPSITYRAGTSTIEVRAERGVNVQSLLVSAKIRPNDDPQTIVQKVNTVRQRLYPDREIAITASVPRGTATSGVRLWRYYLAWNRSSRIYYWWNPMLAAATFISDTRGTWQYYECNGCSTWRYMAQILTGGSYTRALAGGFTIRGFDYRPKTYGARADIVMYFFN